MHAYLLIVGVSTPISFALALDLHPIVGIPFLEGRIPVLPWRGKLCTKNISSFSRTYRVSIFAVHLKLLYSDYLKTITHYATIALNGDRDQTNRS